MLARKYPALANYWVLVSQPAFWLESLTNLELAESEFEEKNG